jgi:hypothetical protein
MQGLKEEKKKSDAETLAHQYGKAIIFDYSYKYFYNDGYGKEYRIYNLKESLSNEQRNLYLTGYLLSFYQQMKIYQHDKAAFAPFNIENPLLVFVGNSVNKTVSRDELTDVQEVVVFIHGFTANKEKTVDRIKMLLDDNQFENESLFKKINEKNSKINILIGSKKFTEGWNSWRVSTMGLINFARGEGSQAIQLFGRGVRLKGYENCLKRSAKLDYPATVPNNIRKIETLTIFGVKADYMTQFKEYLEKEDLDLNDSIREFKLPVISRFLDVKDKLKVIKVKEGIHFKKQSKRLVLTAPGDGLMDNLVKNKIKVDYNDTVQSLTSTRGEDVNYQKDEAVLELQHIAFLDGDKLYRELLQYKNQKAYYNISIEKPLLPEILKIKGWYTLFIPKALMEIDSFDKIVRINDICVMLLKNYLNRFFKYHKAQWEAPYLVYGDLKSNDQNFIDEYSITLFNKDRFDEFEQLFEGINDALKKNRRLNKYQDKHLNFRYFDFYSHLYTPLISIDQGIRIEVSPVSLNSDEKLFIDRLKDYCDANPAAFTEKRMYLLRNKSKVGMGFFETGNFYPDYIMWIAETDKQYITFIDPKGIMILGKNINNTKIQFYKTIKEREARLQPTYVEKQVVLNSFILSGTPAADASAFYGLKKPEFESRNVLFLEDEDCMEKLMSKVL